MSIPSRREIRNETLRVSDLMSCADGGKHDCVGAGDPSHGRRVLLRKLCPLCGSICGANSWPESITCPLTSDSKIDCVSHVLARSLFVQPKHAQTSLRPPAEIQARIGHRTRGREAETVSLSSRTCSDSDRRADRTARSKIIRAKHGASTEQRLFHVKHTSESPDIVPFICATESPPQGRRIYPAHVSAVRTQTARG